jgi:hypothetical protein
MQHPFHAIGDRPSRVSAKTVYLNGRSRSIVQAHLKGSAASASASGGTPWFPATGSFIQPYRLFPIGCSNRLHIDLFEAFPAFNHGLVCTLALSPSSARIFIQASTFQSVMLPLWHTARFQRGARFAQESAARNRIRFIDADGRVLVLGFQEASPYGFLGSLISLRVWRVCGFRTSWFPCDCRCGGG